ncbi:MAG: dethiobiotin synthase, partial [Candidatus Omnitrophica bacterium]|nr:dethiobiotin synthase [Candidatus Omnitrophota bacterium]
MRKDVFITGTDTGVGKTIVAGLLLRFLREKGLNAVTQKWVQTGSYDVSEDVRAHMGFIDGATESMKKYAEDIAPYIFRFPASPHLAASLENVEISFEKIERCFKRLSSEFDRVIVEG